MPIAHYLQTIRPRRTVRVDKRLRVDLEVSLGQGMDVATRDDRLHRPTPAEQEAARLERMRLGSVCEKLFDQGA